METLAQVVAIIGSAVGATWFICRKLSEIEATIERHIALDERRFDEISAKVIKLEERRAKRAQKYK